jgi:hypothetical protein
MQALVRKRLWIVVLCVIGCIDPYDPPRVSETGNLIVVEGVVNTTDKIATVRLTHPAVLNSDDGVVPESGATVTIRTSNGKTYDLEESSPGNYEFKNIDIHTGMQCELSVSTRDGGLYQSPMVEMKATPPIDSVYFKYLGDGLEVVVDTHDSENKSTWYQWTYTETWEYTAPFESNFKLVYYNQYPVPVYRSIAERIYRCYKTAPSTRINIASTEHLASDRVNGKLLVAIPVANQKTSIRYSIIVKQRAVSREEYDYLTQLQKTTESVGGLFDAQPSQVYGNIKNVSEKGGDAIGYFNGGSYDQKRIFLGFYDLPPHLLKPLGRSGCEVDTVCTVPPRYSTLNCVIDLENLSPSALLIDEVQDGITSFGFTKATDECADCRSQGGVLQRPDFW